VNAALKRRTPMHFSNGMAGAIAGKPIALRFISSATIQARLDDIKPIA
jgi:hypothetical protein